MKNITYLMAVLLIAPIAGAQSFVATPLTDLGSQTYKGFAGGLYENHSNIVPADHHTDGLIRAAQIHPINGHIVMLNLGMSNSWQEFTGFMVAARLSRSVRSEVALLNGADGGDVGCTWAVPFATTTTACDGQLNRANQYDRVRDQILAPAGFQESDVQVVYLDDANLKPTIALPSKQADAYSYEVFLGSIVRAVATRYPNVKLMFLTSREYGGYATTNLNPEPFAYEYGFAVKWLIQAQVDQLRGHGVDSRAGDLNYLNGTAPWLAWGPYLWADGTTPRSDGFSWTRNDFYATDGTHLTDAGKIHAGTQILNYLMTSPYAAWFRR